MEKQVKQNWHFNHKPEVVWEYLTKPELIAQWLMENDFKPLVGHKFSFTHAVVIKGPYDGVTNCEVLEVKPFSKLSYTWDGGLKDKSRTYNTKVVWTLIPKVNGTELQVEHSGFKVLEDVVAHDGGWNACLKKMEEQINTTTK